jgi:hypothetical protein
MVVEIHKGQLLVVKTPPYYQKTYFYEVIAAGDKQIRAALYHSPKVKKHWTRKEFDLLLEMGMVRLAERDELPAV